MIARLLVTVSSLGSNPENQCHEIFRFRFFSWIIYPQAPENNIRVISNFCRKFQEIFTSKGAPLVSTTKAANLPPVSWHQWQIMETILDWWHLTGNSKEKINLYVNSPNPRCPKKNFSDWNFFSFATGGGAPWAANISAIFRKNSKRSERYPQGNGGNCFMKETWETWSRKSRGTVPLRGIPCVKIYSFLN